MFNVNLNPASDYLTIEGEGEMQVGIIDVSGRLLLNEEQISSLHRMDVTVLAKGVYVIEVESEKGKGVQEVFEGVKV